jgi:hypothetical protein
VLVCLCVSALFGCSPIVDGTFSDIEVSRLDIAVPGAPTSAATTVGFQFTFASGQLGANTNLEAQSRIRSAELRRLLLKAKTGISDLSFIRTLHAVAFVPASKTTTTQTSRQVEIADYQQRGTPSPSPIFEVPLPEPVDILPLLRPRKTEPAKVVVSVNLGGELPMVSWTTDVSMELSLEIHE